MWIDAVVGLQHKDYVRSQTKLEGLTGEKKRTFEVENLDRFFR